MCTGFTAWTDPPGIRIGVQTAGERNGGMPIEPDGTTTRGPDGAWMRRVSVHRDARITVHG